MIDSINRRILLRTGATLATVATLPAWAQTPPTLRFAAVFSDKDIRAEMMNMFAKEMAADFKVEQHLNSTL
jgi:TRAP-type transport system periplasmic protein